MSELATLARPYAKAAFAHALEAKDAATWSGLLQQAVVVIGNESFERIIKNPALTAANKSTGLLNAIANSNEGFARFVTLLGENNRLELLPAISQEFALLKAASEGELKVEVQSAFALTAAQVDLLKAKLNARYNTQVDMTVVENSALIAGVIIRMGDQVIDDSALGKLEKLRTALA